MEAILVPLETKLAWARRLAASGVKILQVGSFVHPKLVPQMADTDELCRRLYAGPDPGIVVSALVLNEKGLERALASGVPMICMGVSASETHSQKNTRMSVDEALARIVAMARIATDGGREVQVSVQSAFGCAFEGTIPFVKVLRIVERYLEEGLRRISLADTAGHATPLQTRRLVAAVLAMDPDVELTCHLHNTYGAGIANCIAAIDSGVNWLETAFGGLGGCPFTKVAGGNVCTEDLGSLLRKMGVLPEFDPAPVLEVTRDAVRVFGKELPGCLYKIDGTGPESTEA
jgi:hydroxymethylglutaryl-CoA lyase